MLVAGWRLYYANGSVIDSNQSSWNDAPDDAVQILAVFYDKFDTKGRRYRALFHGSPGNAGDYYWQFGAGTAKDVPPGADVKYGLMMEPKADFLAIYNRALGDCEW